MHERRLRLGAAGVGCHDDCPHAEARTLWAEALVAFGARAQELVFLRSQAATGPASPGETGIAAADHARALGGSAG